MLDIPKLKVDKVDKVVSFGDLGRDTPPSGAMAPQGKWGCLVPTLNVSSGCIFRGFFWHFHVMAPLLTGSVGLVLDL